MLDDHIDPFSLARRQFHDLRGRLAVVLNSVEYIRAEPDGCLNPAQRDHLERIEQSAAGMLDALDQTRAQVLAALALMPDAVQPFPCLRGTLVDSLLLADALHQLGPVHADVGRRGIVVAPPDILPTLRRAFLAQNWSMRAATAPDDVPYLLEAAPAALIALAPDLADTAEWWVALRIALDGLPAVPALVHLIQAA